MKSLNRHMIYSLKKESHSNKGGKEFFITKKNQCTKTFKSLNVSLLFHLVTLTLTNRHLRTRKELCWRRRKRLRLYILFISNTNTHAHTQAHTSNWWLQWTISWYSDCGAYCGYADWGCPCVLSCRGTSDRKIVARYHIRSAGVGWEHRAENSIVHNAGTHMACPALEWLKPSYLTAWMDGDCYLSKPKISSWVT